MDILKIIEENGLSIRQIPKIIINRYDIRHHKPGNKIETWKPTIEYFQNQSFGGSPESRMKYFYQKFPEGRQFTVEEKIPTNAGKWMCKQIGNTDSMVKWDMRTDNLADTLEESVLMWYAKENGLTYQRQIKLKG